MTPPPRAALIAAISDNATLASEWTRIAAAIECPGPFSFRGEQKEQVLPSWDPVECGSATIVPFIHTQGSGYLPAQSLIHAQCVHVGRYAFGIVFVMKLAGLDKSGLDHQLAGKVLSTNKTGLGNIAERLRWKR